MPAWLRDTVPICEHARMQTLSVISQKGGAGKTTLALNLAVASELAGSPAVLVDVDPQSSAAAWGDSRESEAPVVVSAQAARLGEVLETAREHGAELAIIDTAPHAQTDALNAARAADLVLVPCRPSVLDLRAIGASADVAALARTHAVAVLCAVPSPGAACRRGGGGAEGRWARRGVGSDRTPRCVRTRGDRRCRSAGAGTGEQSCGGGSSALRVGRGGDGNKGDMTVTRASLAQALKAKEAPTPTPKRETATETSERAPSRQGRRAVTFYTTPEAHRQLRLLSIELDRSVQSLGIEALNALFAQHGKAQIGE